MPVLHLDMQNLSRVNSAMEELGNTCNKICFYDICDESNACLTIHRPLSLTLSCEQANSTYCYRKPTNKLGFIALFLLSVENNMKNRITRKEQQKLIYRIDVHAYLTEG